MDTIIAANGKQGSSGNKKSAQENVKKQNPTFCGKAWLQTV
jgi:hypothetical protein